MVIAVTAGLAGTVLLAVPALAPAPALVRPSAALTVGRSTGPPVTSVVAGAPVVAPRLGSSTPFRWPLSPAPQVLRRFAVGPQPWSPGHRGVDLGAEAGQHVLAAGAGTVAFAGLVAGRGVITVAHDGGLRTTYEPVIAEVTAGQAVTAGDALGVLAPGSHCTTTCLHWGALRGDVYVDPLTLLSPPAPPILLPLGAGR
jgi:murein DD-endopeptidase MepM/ murein hydrolase activator NlpD